MSKKIILIILLIIVFIGGFLRIYKLHSIPPGLYPDEAMNANDAFDNPGQPFYPENNGREGLYMNLVFLSFKIFGINVFALRFVSAIIGTITILGLYLLTKELFSFLRYKGAETIALFSSFFLAVSFWHINFSRIGFRGILLPFCFTFCFYFLFKGLRTKSIFSFIYAGIFLGLGFYTYSAYRMSFLIFLAVFSIYFMWALRKKEIKNFFLNSFVFTLAALITAFPLIYYFINNPGTFFGRLGQVSVFSQENPIKSFLISTFAHLYMLNIRGDCNWRHNLSGSPQLFFPIGILFILGLAIGFRRCLLAHKKKDFKRLLVFYFLFSWFFAMLLPGALTYEGIPHSLRTIGVIPVCYIFAALGAFNLYEKIKKVGTRKAMVIILISACFLVSWQFHKYFYTYAKNENLKGAFTENLLELGQFINAQSDKVYVIVNQGGTPVPWPDGIAMPAQTLIFIEKTKYQKARAVYLKPDQLGLIKDEKAIILPLNPNDEIINELRTRFPNNQITYFGQNNKAIKINY